VKYALILLSCFLLFAAGWFSHQWLHPPVFSPVVKPIVQNIIVRNYDEMAMLEMQRALVCYDTSPFSTVATFRESQSVTTLTYQVSLCDRRMSQDILIPVREVGNWKLYVGVGVGVVATAGLVYLAAQVVK